MTSIYIPSSVRSVPDGTFEGCSLRNVVFGAGVTAIEDFAFYEDSHLTQALFLGNAPTVIQTGDQPPFGGCPVTVYYLPGTTGWSNTFGQTIYFNDGAPTAVWNPVLQTTDGNFGVRSNRFGFNITGGSNLPVAILACTNIGNPVWTPLMNVTLTNGSYYFSEPLQTNTPRFYGLGFP